MNGGSRLTSTSEVADVGTSGSSTPSRRTHALVPSVKNTSPLNGSATAAAPSRSATLTATSMLPTA